MTLEYYLRHTGLTPSEFARDANITPTQVHNFLKKKNLPSLPVFRKIKLATNGLVSLEDWFDD